MSIYKKIQSVQVTQIQPAQIGWLHFGLRIFASLQLSRKVCHRAKPKRDKSSRPEARKALRIFLELDNKILKSIK